MSKELSSSSSLLLFQAFFIGLGASGFLCITADLLVRVPGAGGLFEPFYTRFFPDVNDGLGLLLSSFILFGIGYLPSLLKAKKS